MVENRGRKPPIHFYCLEHQHKAIPYKLALVQYGYKSVLNMRIADMILIDFTRRGLFAGKGDLIRPQVRKAMERKMPIIVYPHSVRPNIPFDLTTRFTPVDALFTIAEGHKEVLLRIGYPYPIEVSGWAYTPIKEFIPIQPKKRIKVTYAPIHPVGSSPLHPLDLDLNRMVYEKLLAIKDKIDLTVRHIFTLEKNGLYGVNGVRFVRAKPDGSTAEIESADVVIASYTYAYMTVALGKPLIMMGEYTRSHNTPQFGGKLKFAKKWASYKEYMRYPYNVEEACDLYEMILEVMQDGKRIERWKQLFIGSPFDGNEFARQVNDYVTKNR